MSDTTLILFLIVFLPAAVLLNPYLEKNSKKKIFKSLGVSLVLLIVFIVYVLIFGEVEYFYGEINWRKFNFSQSSFHKQKTPRMWGLVEILKSLFLKITELYQPLCKYFQIDSTLVLRYPYHWLPMRSPTIYNMYLF